MKERFIIVTHDGTFHADDVFAAATLTLAHPDEEIEIVRSRNEQDFSIADILVDVGGEYDPERLRFDHHQPGGAGVRENGIPYASFGLVWKHYGEILAGSIENAQLIDEKLVQGIDGHDNGVVQSVPDKGVYPYTIGEMLALFRPAWNEERTNDEAFLDAVNIAITVLTRMILHTKSYAESASFIRQAYDHAPGTKRIIELPQEYPGWRDVLTQYPEPLFVVYQREDGNWTVKAVPIDPLQFKLRLPFPESWAGLRDEALQEASGIPDAVFCHNGRFTAVAKTKAGAVRLAEQAIAT